MRASRTAHSADPATGPDLSAAGACSDFLLFVPGVTASLVVFILFGTTRTFRDDMWRWFVPRRLREAHEARQWARRTPSSVVVPSAQALPMPPVPSPRRPSNAKFHDAAGQQQVFIAELDGSPRSWPSDGLDEMVDLQVMGASRVRSHGYGGMEHGST